MIVTASLWRRAGDDLVGGHDPAQHVPCQWRNRWTRPVGNRLAAPSLSLLRQLRLLRAVEPFLMELANEPDASIENAIALLRRAGRVSPGDKLIIATDILSLDRLVDSIQLRTVK